MSPPTIAIPSGFLQLRAGAAPERERDAREQRGHRRHDDRPEPQESGLRDRVLGLLLVAALGVEREVDHHDRVLLDDADEKNDADERDDREVVAAEDEREEGPDARGRERREDRDGVDRALVQDAEEDVDRHERRENEERRVRERRAERPRGPLESRLDALGQAELLSRLLDGPHRPSERGVRSEVEGHRRDGELPLVVHGKRRVRRSRWSRASAEAPSRRTMSAGRRSGGLPAEPAARAALRGRRGTG